MVTPISESSYRRYSTSAPWPPPPPFNPASLGLSPIAEKSGPVVIILAVCGSILICFAIGLAVYYRRKLSERPRRKAPGVVSGAEMQSTRAKEYKLIPMDQITFSDQLGTGAFGVVYHGTFQATKCAIKKSCLGVSMCVSHE